MKKSFWHKLQKPFLALAPMEDVTDFSFREILAEIGPPDVFFTEFTNTDGLTSTGKDAVIKRLKYSDRQRPIVAQLWGNNPKTMEEAARITKDLGFDGIDINMGCPDKAVIKIGAGSALIENPELAGQLIEAAKTGAPDIPISIKTRIGFNKIATESWIKYLLKQNIAAITVHGRTKKQMSKVPANWEEIEKAVKIRDEMNLDTLIIGNGDITNFEDAINKAKNYGVDGVMVGRGVFADPWIFAGKRSGTRDLNIDESLPVAKHTEKECLDLLLKHTKLFVDTWGKEKPFALMKKFFKIYVRDFDGANELRQKLMECDSVDEVEIAIKNSKY